MDPHPNTATIVAAAAVNACWDRIGVQGDASCPELKQHVHCRNCPVYSAGAMQLLDREMAADALLRRDQPSRAAEARH